MENITASEIVGELRRAARVYEVLKRAEEMVAVIANLEQMEKELQRKIGFAEGELKDTKDKVESVLNKAQGELAGAKAEAAKIKETNAVAREEAATILRKAREDAKALIDQAKSEAEVVKAEIVKLRQERHEAWIDRNAMSAALQQLQDEMQAKKEQLLKAFS